MWGRALNGVANWMIGEDDPTNQQQPSGGAASGPQPRQSHPQQPQLQPMTEEIWATLTPQQQFQYRQQQAAQQQQQHISSSTPASITPNPPLINSGPQSHSTVISPLSPTHQQIVLGGPIEIRSVPSTPIVNTNQIYSSTPGMVASNSAQIFLASQQLSSVSLAEVDTTVGRSLASAPEYDEEEDGPGSAAIAPSLVNTYPTSSSPTTDLLSNINSTLPPPSFVASTNPPSHIESAATQIGDGSDASNSLHSTSALLSQPNQTSLASPPPPSFSPSNLPFPSTLPTTSLPLISMQTVKTSPPIGTDAPPSTESMIMSPSSTTTTESSQTASGPRGLLARLNPFQRSATNQEETNADTINTTPVNESSIEGSPNTHDSSSTSTSSSSNASKVAANAKASLTAAFSSVRASASAVKGSVSASAHSMKERMAAGASVVKESVTGSVTVVKESVQGSVAVMKDTVSKSLTLSTSASSNSSEVTDLIHQLQQEEKRSAAIHKEYKLIISEKDGIIREREAELDRQAAEIKLRFREMDQWKQRYEQEFAKAQVLQQQLTNAANTITELQIQVQSKESALVPLANKLALTERERDQTRMILQSLQSNNNYANEIVELKNEIERLKESSTSTSPPSTASTSLLPPTTSSATTSSVITNSSSVNAQLQHMQRELLAPPFPSQLPRAAVVANSTAIRAPSFLTPQGLFMSEPDPFGSETPSAVHFPNWQSLDEFINVLSTRNGFRHILRRSQKDDNGEYRDGTYVCEFHTSANNDPSNQIAGGSSQSIRLSCPYEIHFARVGEQGVCRVNERILGHSHVIDSNGQHRPIPLMSLPPPTVLSSHPTFTTTTTTFLPDSVPVVESEGRSGIEADQLNSTAYAAPPTDLTREGIEPNPGPLNPTNSLPTAPIHLELVFQYFTLSDLAIQLAVSRAWGRIVETMPSIQTYAPTRRVRFANGAGDSDVSHLPLMCGSPNLKRHINAFGNRSEGRSFHFLTWESLSLIGTTMTHITMLYVEIRLPVRVKGEPVLPVAITLPPALTSFNFHMLHFHGDEMTVQDLQSILLAASRCTQLVHFGMLLYNREPIVDDPHCFHLLTEMTHLTSFCFSCKDFRFGTNSFADEQIQDLRHMYFLDHMHFGTPSLDLSILRRLLAQPHQLQWKELTILPERIDDEAVELLSSLTKLTRWASYDCSRFSNFAFLHNRLPDLTDCRLATFRPGSVADLVTALSHCPQLRRLTLLGSELTCEHLQELLPHLVVLEELILWRHSTLRSFACFKSGPILKTLKELELGANDLLEPPLDLEELNHLLNLQQLHTLHINNFFRAPIPTEVASKFVRTSQRFRYLTDCNLTYFQWVEETPTTGLASST